MWLYGDMANIGHLTAASLMLVDDQKRGQKVLTPTRSCSHHLESSHKSHPVCQAQHFLQFKQSICINTIDHSIQIHFSVPAMYVIICCAYFKVDKHKTMQELRYFFQKYYCKCTHLYIYVSLSISFSVIQGWGGLSHHMIDDLPVDISRKQKYKLQQISSEEEEIWFLLKWKY